MKAVLIDDEKDALEVLEWTITKNCPEVQIVGKFDSPLTALATVGSLQADVIFLDIEMPGLNGFDLLEKLSPYDFEVVFTTAHNQFALKALKISALDYLLKPIDAEELRTAVRKALSRRNKMNGERLEALMKFIKPEKPKTKRVALTVSDHLRFVETSDIVYCESDSNYTMFFLTTREKVVVSKTLKDVEEILEGSDFFRVHASYLINMNHISKFTRGDGGYVVMSNNQHITVSRKKKDEFFEMFSKL